jgi:SOS response regulatory protein OraA/RecX
MVIALVIRSNRRETIARGIRWVRDAREKGYSNKEINSILHQKGWTRKEIKTIMEYVESRGRLHR